MGGFLVVSLPCQSLQVATLEAELHQLFDPGHPRINPGTKHSDHAGPSQVASKGDIYRVSQSKSKLWERDIAKLFTRRIELFTKVEYTQVHYQIPLFWVCGMQGIGFSLWCFRTELEIKQWNSCMWLSDLLRWDAHILFMLISRS